MKVPFDDNKLYASEVLSILLQVLTFDMIIAISFIFPLVLKIIIVRMSQQTDCCLETWKQWTACFSSSPTTRDTTQLLLKR